MQKLNRATNRTLDSRKNTELEMKSLLDRLNQKIAAQSLKMRTDEANPDMDSIDLMNQLKLVRTKTQYFLEDLQDPYFEQWDEQLPTMRLVFEQGEKLLTIPN